MAPSLGSVCDAHANRGPESFLAGALYLARDAAYRSRDRLAKSQCILSCRHRPHDRLSVDPRAAWAIRSGDAEEGAFHPAFGDMHLGPENALKALALLGGGVFLPVHWGTFSLAMHAGDQPAEALLRLSERADA